MAIDVELKTLKQSNTTWPSTFKASNRFPIVANRVFATLANAQAYVDDTAADASAYAGIVLAVVQDTTAKNNGVYYVQSHAVKTDDLENYPNGIIPGKLVKVGGTETENAENYSEAKELSKTLVVGQLIKVASAETIGDETYQAGFYIVEGAGLISSLSTSTGADDEVGALKARVDSVETKLEGIQEGAEKNYITSVTETYLSVTGGNLSVDLSSKVDVSTYSKDIGTINGNLQTKADAQDLTTHTANNNIHVTTEDKAAWNAAEQNAKNYADGKFLLKTDAYKDEEIRGLISTETSNREAAINGLSDIYVAKNGYVAYSQGEKDKLAGIATGAQVNYVKSVGNNLSVDAEGKLTVSIPEVEVPFQSVAEGDKVLTLTDGVLSSTLSYAREEVKGVDSLVLKGVKGEVIGSVPVADFVADGMLESVTPVENTNEFLFTFKTGNGTTKEFKVDFSKYVDTYRADGDTIELGENNTFKVKANVFDAHGAAAAVSGALESYKTENNAAVALKANAADVYTTTDADAKFVEKVEGKALSTNDFTNDLKSKLEGIAAGAEVNYVKSVGDKLAVSEAGELTVDLSAYATTAYTNEELAKKLNAVATVNGKSFVNDAVVIGGNDVALGEAITRTEDGEVKNVYSAKLSVQSVLANLSQRIDELDPNIAGELGIISIVEGNGIKAETSDGQATISVKASTKANNAVVVDTDGIYVQHILISGTDVEE